MKAKKSIRTADIDGVLAANLFTGLNPDVEYLYDHPFDVSSLYGVLVTDTDPNDLVYPEGWYFAKGSFSNKHNSQTGLYYEIPLIRHDGARW